MFWNVFFVFIFSMCVVHSMDGYYQPTRSSAVWGYFTPPLLERVPLQPQQTPMEAMVEITNNLGVAILQDHSFSRGNFAFSPYGVASVLVVLYEGARRESARQIHRAVKFPVDKEIIRVGFRDIHRNLRSYFSHEGYLSGISLNKQSCSLKPEYKKILKFYGYDVDFNTTLDDEGEAGSGSNTPDISTKPEVNITTAFVPQTSTTEMTPGGGDENVTSSESENRHNTTPSTVSTSSEGLNSTTQGFTETVMGTVMNSSTTAMEEIGENTTEPNSVSESASVSESTSESESPTVSVSTSESDLNSVPESASESESASAPESASESDPNAVSEPTSEFESSSEAQPESVSVSESTSESESSSEAEAQSESESPSESEINSEAQSESSPESPPTSEVQSESESAPESPPSSEAQSQSAPESPPSFEAQSQSAPESPPSFEAESESSPESPPTSEVQSESESPPESPPSSEAQSQSAPESSPSSEPQSRSALESSPSSEVQSEFGSAPESSPSSDPQSQSAPESSPTPEVESEPPSEFKSNKPEANETITPLPTTTPPTTIEQDEEFQINITVDNTINCKNGTNCNRTDETTAKGSNQTETITETKEAEVVVEEITNISIDNGMLIPPSNNSETITQTESKEMDSEEIYKFNQIKGLINSRASLWLDGKPKKRKERTITDYLKSPQNLDLSLQLQNGMYDTHVSRNADFYGKLPRVLFLINGAVDVPVPMMIYTNVFAYAYIPRLHSKALEFPLDDVRYKLLIILPVERRGLRQLIHDLADYPLSNVLETVRPARVKAVVPTFMVEGFVILTSSLQKLGIWDVFDPRKANLSGMSTDPELYVRNVEQSVTVVIRNYVEILDIQTRTMAARQMEYEFEVTHPFLYFVLDTATNVALMAGQILDPLNSSIY